MTRKTSLNLLKIGLVLVVIFIGYKLLPYMDTQAIHAWVDSYGRLAPIFYIGLWTVLPIFLFPVPPLALPGGILFGLVEGSIYTLIGVFLNASLMYFMTKGLFKNQVKNFLYPRLPESVLSRLYLKEQRSLWMFFFILRFLPIISYNLINYAAGLTEINYKNHITSTLIGVIPGTIAYINFGDKMLDPKSSDFIIAIGFVVLIVVISLLVAKFYMPKGQGGANGDDHNNTNL